MCPNLPVKDSKFLNTCVFLLRKVPLKGYFIVQTDTFQFPLSKVKHMSKVKHISLKSGPYFCPLGLFLLRLHPKDCLWVRYVNKLILILVSWSKVKVIAELFEKALSVFYFLTPWPSLSHTLAKECSDLQSSVCVKFQGHIIPLGKTPVHSFFLS